MKAAFQSSAWRFLATLVSVMAWKVAMALALMLAISVTSGVSVLMLIPMLHIVGLDVGQDNLGQLANFIDRGFAALGLQPTSASVIGLYIAVMTSSALLMRWKSIFTQAFYQEFVMLLRQRLYRTITSVNWLFYTRHRSSTFTHVLTNEFERIGGAASALMSLTVQVILTSFYVLLALFLAPLMTGLILASGIVLSLLLWRKTRLGRKKGEAVSLAYEDMYAAISEHLAGMKTSKSHGVEDSQVDIFQNRANQVAEMHVDMTRNRADVGFWLSAGSMAILGLILYFALEVLALTAATILLLLFLFSRLIPMVSGIQRGYQSFINKLPAFDHVMDVQARCEAAAEPAGDPSLSLRLRQAIRLEQVWFSYESEGEAKTIQGVDLTVAAGRTTAIVGPSGAGKSTVVDLVVGLIAPEQGKVTIDGKLLRAEQLRAWRGQIGYVAQDTFLFHDTVRANLLVVRPEATEEEVWQALRSAAAADFVAALPRGLDTVVGDRGVKLSGGERQRLALARALLRRPALLVLDEATSSLDTENEERIQQAIDKLRGKMTILVIAHRLSTIRNADVIHVLEHGRVVESGDWQTLYHKEGGRFRALCEAQGLHGESWAAAS